LEDERFIDFRKEEVEKWVAGSTYYSAAKGYLADCSLWVEMMHPDSLR